MLFRSGVPLNPTTKDFDTHGSWVAGSGYNAVAGTWTTNPGYVFPVSGKYLVSWSAPVVMPPSTAFSVFSSAVVYRGVTQIRSVQGSRVGSTTNASGDTIVSTGSVVFNVLAGDKLVYQVFQSSGASRSTGVDTRENFISIVRVGN